MKTKIDMTIGSLWDKILLFALPLAATGILQQLFNAADLAVVGRYAGLAPMAAVGSNMPITGFFITFFVGLSLGTNVVIATAIGRNDPAAVNKAVHTAITFAAIAGIIIAFVVQPVIFPLLQLLKVPDDTIFMASIYLRIFLGGAPFIFLYNFEAAIFRSTGNTRTPLIVLGIAGVLNLCLNIIFVRHFGMNADGVGIATTISNGFSAFTLFYLLTKDNGSIKVNLKHLGIDKKIFKEILRIGVPSGIQSTLFSVSNMTVQSAINSLGSTVMAASSAAQNVESFTYLLINSFGQASATFTGQNNGAGKHDRCRKTVYLSLAFAELLLFILATILFTFSNQILGLFNTDPAVIEVGKIRLAWLMFAHIFGAVNEVMSGYLRGYGMAYFPAISAFVCACGFRILWVNTVFPVYPALFTIVLVYPISLGLAGLFLCITAIIVKPGKRAMAA